MKKHWFLEQSHISYDYKKLTKEAAQELEQKCVSMDCWIGVDNNNFARLCYDYTLSNKVIGKQIELIQNGLDKITSVYGDTELSDLDDLGIGNNTGIDLEDEEAIATFFVDNVRKYFIKVDNSPLTNRQINKLIEITAEYNKKYWPLFWRGDICKLHVQIPYLVKILNLLYNKNYTYFKLPGKYNSSYDVYCIGDINKRAEVIKALRIVTETKNTFIVYLTKIEDTEDPNTVNYKQNSRGSTVYGGVSTYEQEELKIKQWFANNLDQDFPGQYTINDITVKFKV